MSMKNNHDILDGEGNLDPEKFDRAIEQENKLHNLMLADSDGDPKEVFQEERDRQGNHYHDNIAPDDARISQFIETYLHALFRDGYLCKNWKGMKKEILEATKRNLMSATPYLERMSKVGGDC
jgi:hypothetical protein